MIHNKVLTQGKTVLCCGFVLPPLKGEVLSEARRRGPPVTDATPQSRRQAAAPAFLALPQCLSRACFATARQRRDCGDSVPPFSATGSGGTQSPFRGAFSFARAFCFCTRFRRAIRESPLRCGRSFCHCTNVFDAVTLRVDLGIDPYGGDDHFATARTFSMR